MEPSKSTVLSNMAVAADWHSPARHEYMPGGLAPAAERRSLGPARGIITVVTEAARHLLQSFDSLPEADKRKCLRPFSGRPCSLPTRVLG